MRDGFITKLASLFAGLIIVAFIIVMAAIYGTFPAHAQQPQATVAKIVPFMLVGPGPYLVINAEKRVVATVVAGRVIPLAGVRFVNPPVPMVRYQIEQIGPDGPRTEPKSCRRGMRVLRYGFWGC